MRRIRHIVVSCVLLVLVLAVVSPLQAQTSEGGLAPVLPTATSGSYYYISKPGELTMQVNIWGYVRDPGRYEIPTFTDIIQLVSYAGGPTADADIDDVRVTRVARTDSTVRRSEFTIDLEDIANAKQEDLILHPGDTIVIERTTWASLRDVISVVTTAALITTAVANMIIAQNSGR